MATTRPFAYNPGSTINGTTQYGQIAVGDIDTSYSSDYGDVKWWMGPDESIDGYLIAIAVPSNTQPTEIPGTSASVGFYRSKGCGEQDFLDLLAVLPFSKNETFTSGDNAKSWLNNNGYWTSWGVTTPICNGNPAPTPTPSSTNALILPTPTPTNTPTHTSTPTPSITPSLTSTTTPTPTPTTTPTITPSSSTSGSSYSGYTYVTQCSMGGITNGDLFMFSDHSNSITYNPSAALSNGFIVFSAYDNDNVDRTSFYSVLTGNTTMKMTQGGNSVILSVTTGAFNYQPNGAYSLFIYDSDTGAGNLTLISQEGGAFTCGQPMTISILVSGGAPSPTPSASAAGGGGISGGEYFFYSDEGVVNLGPPVANGNTTFINGSYETYNPNYTGGTLFMYFNRFTANGADNLNLFTGLTSTGGTISLTQNGDNASFSGISSQFVYSNMGGSNGYLQFSITSNNQQLTSSTNPFVSGTTISLSINGSSGGNVTPTPTPSTSGIPVTPSVTPTITPTNSLTPSTTPTNTPTASITPTQTVTPTITPSSSQPAIVYKMIVAGGGNAIAASNDTNNWVASNNAATFLATPALAAAANSNMFVAGGNFGSTNPLIYSYNGVDWSGSTNGSTMFTTQVNAIAYGDGMWIAVGISSGAAKIAYSTDGITWTAAANSNIFGSTPLAVAYEPTSGRWVATAQKGGGNTNTIAYSDDGITWTAAYNSWTIFSGACRSVVHDGTKWLAVGDGVNRMAYSNDGYTWYAVSSGNSAMTSIGYGIASNASGQSVAVGQGTNKIIYSYDGFTWSAATNSSSIFSIGGYCVTYDYNNNKWIAGGLGTNQLAISTDGINWTATTNGNTIMNDRVRAIASKH